MAGTFSLQTMRSVEAKALAPERKQSAGARIFGLFLLVVIGIIASWFWDIGTTYLKDTSKGLQLGSWTEFLVRVGLALVVAGVTFVAIYNKVGKSSGESWIPYFLAFQNGFFWEAILEGVSKQAG